jgi:hypothetical protein
MEDRFGDEFTKKPQKEIGPGSKFMAEFENIKRKFAGYSRPETLRLNLDWDNLDEYDEENGGSCASEVTQARIASNND